MSAIDHERIYLQPPCCANEDVGRLWCEDPDPTDCEDGKAWTEYVRAGIYDQIVAERDHLRERVAELEAERREIKHAVKFAPSSAHWSEELKRLLGADARSGIDALERNHRDSIQHIKAQAIREAANKLCAIRDGSMFCKLVSFEELNEHANKIEGQSNG